MIDNERHALWKALSHVNSTGTEKVRAEHLTLSVERERNTRRD